MSELTRPWKPNQNNTVSYSLDDTPVTRWCRSGDHSFETTSRTAVCCNDPKHQAKYKADQKKQQLENAKKRRARLRNA